MYTAYWQLATKPFEPTADPRFYYPGESQQAALLKLRYALDQRRAAAVLAGEAGLGKSLLIDMLLRQLGAELAPRLHVVFPDLPVEQLLAWLADEVTGERGAARNLDDSLHRLETQLTENAEAGRHAVVVIDEAQLLRDLRTLDALRLLLNFHRDGQPLLTLVFAGQTALVPTVERLPALDQRLAVKCLLRRFTPVETAGYVQHRLAAAGAVRPLFDDDAVAALHELGHGIPRQINRLGDLALLVGYAEESPCVTAGQIESIAAELAAVGAD